MTAKRKTPKNIEVSLDEIYQTCRSLFGNGRIEDAELAVEVFVRRFIGPRAKRMDYDLQERVENYARAWIEHYAA